jgi:LacI family transcriptional regulator
MTKTLKEIAEQLDISPATVSRALNDKPGVATRTRKRILELMGSSDPSYNSSQGAGRPQTHAIAFVIRRWTVSDSPFYDRIMMGVEQEVEKHGYHLISISIDQKQMLENDWMPPILNNKDLNGMIIAGCEFSKQAMNKLFLLQLPTVLVGNTLHHRPSNAISSDNHEGGYQAALHLIEHGHRDILFISGPRSWVPVQERILGYTEAMLEHSLTPLVEYIEYPDYPDSQDTQSKFDKIKTILEKHPQVTAVCVKNDPLAFKVMQTAREMGKRVPEDLAVIGYDNIPVAMDTDPPLTTVNIHKVQMGQLAARRMIELLGEAPQPPVTIRVANELIVRESCGCKQQPKYSSDERDGTD